MKIVVLTHQPVFGLGLQLLIQSRFKEAQVYKVRTREQLIACCLETLPDLTVLDIISFCSDPEWDVPKLVLPHQDIKGPIVALMDKTTSGLRYLKAGVNGIIARDCSCEEFMECMTTVLNGAKYLNRNYFAAWPNLL